MPWEPQYRQVLILVNLDKCSSYLSKMGSYDKNINSAIKDTKIHRLFYG